MKCKIQGTFVQHLEVLLEPGQDMYAEKGAIIYTESGIQKESVASGRSLGTLIGARMSGENLFQVRLYNTSPLPRKAVLGSRFGLLPIKIAGETLICRCGAYVAATSWVDVSTRFSLRALQGGMGLRMQKITGRATVVLDTFGDPIVIDIPGGDYIEADENHIIALQGMAESQMDPQWSLRNLFGGEGLSIMRLHGPGRVYLSPGSMYTPQ